MDPGSLLACIYAAALIKVISGAWSLGIGGGSEGEGIHGDSAGRFGGVIGSGNGVASPEDIVGAGPLWTADQNVMWPEDQSINGLYCFSQL